MTTMIVRAEGFLCASSATVYSMAITSFAGKDASAELNPDSPAAAASLPVAVVETKPRCGGGGYAPRFDGLRFIETLVTAHR